jgi:hypothetical protein
LGHHCLDSARYGIAWGAIAAMDCYDTALRYAKERIQFDKPMQVRNYREISRNDYRNHKSTITNMEICFKMKEEQQLLKFLWPKQCRHGNNIAREARQILGANNR